MIEQIVSHYTGLRNSSLSRRPHPDQLKTNAYNPKSSHPPHLALHFRCPSLLHFMTHTKFDIRRKRRQEIHCKTMTPSESRTHIPAHTRKNSCKHSNPPLAPSTPQPIIHLPCNRVPAPAHACYRMRTAPSPSTCKVTLITLHHGQSALTHHNGSNSESGHPKSPWARASCTIQQCGANCARAAGLSRVEAQHSSMAASDGGTCGIGRGIQNASERSPTTLAFFVHF